MRTLKVIFYTVLGWAIGFPTTFAMLCRYNRYGAPTSFFCNPPAWFIVLSLLVLVPLSLFGDYIIGEWAWRKSKLWASIFAIGGLGLAFVLR